MFKVFFWTATTFTACVLAATSVGAAEIRVDPSRTATSGAVLEGKIETGDFDKFKTFVLNGNNPAEIYLASPGGNLAEAMKIGLLVRILKLSTVVPSKAMTNQGHYLTASRHNLKDPNSDYMCASACFFIFVAGIHRTSEDLGPAILGIHMPFLSNDDLKKLNLDQATAVEDRIRTTVGNYLKAMDVPSKYAEDMYSVPKGKIQWIRNDEFQADFAGFIPELRDLVVARCRSAEVEKRGPVPFSDTSMKKNEAQLGCERKLQDELARDAYDNARKRQNGGTRQSTFDGLSPPLPK